MPCGTFFTGYEAGTGKQDKAQHQGTGHVHNTERPGFHGRHVQGVEVERRIGNRQQHHELQQNTGVQATVRLHRFFIHIVGQYMVFIDRQVFCQLRFATGMGLFFGHDKSCLSERR